MQMSPILAVILRLLAWPKNCQNGDTCRCPLFIQVSPLYLTEKMAVAISGWAKFGPDTSNFTS